MPIYAREDIIGNIEVDGKVKCADCMTEDDMMLKADEDFIFFDNPSDYDYIFVCDYCHETI